MTFVIIGGGFDLSVGSTVALAGCVAAMVMVQFGIAADPAVQGKFRNTIKDDPVKESNKKGYVTFAQTSAPNSRSTQIFINFADNSRLDRGGFAPFGEVVTGMPAVDKINAQYGEQPDQELIQKQGNAYLGKEFPRLDYVRKATIVASPAKPAAAKKAPAKPAPAVKK